MNVTNIIKKVKDFLKPRVALLIATALLVISIFIPLITPTSEFRHTIKDEIEYSEAMGNDELVEAAETLLNPSSTKLFSTFAVKALTEKAFLSEAFFYCGIAAGIPILLITAIAALAFFKKHIGVIIFSVLNFLVMLTRNSLLGQVFVDSGKCEWAFGNGFMFFAAILVVAVTIWNVIEKKKKTAIN